MLCFFLFNLVSNIPKQKPIIGVITFAMIPILFITGAVNFILIVVAAREKKPESQNDRKNETHEPVSR
ncbi:MAG: hypothetical protein A2Z74_00790 [Chloroflexi bacterium RBG_13_46_9]|nr:MAG: hypothetical protein A2Z74_00790 [Chloroflexi bacterium RBG_13_46_9]